MRADDDIENVNTLNRDAAEIARVVARKETDAREHPHDDAARRRARGARRRPRARPRDRRAERRPRSPRPRSRGAPEGAHELRALGPSTPRPSARPRPRRRAPRRARAARAPRAARAALYSSISNIKWDYDDALAARGRLGGVVSVAASRSVKRFEIDDADADGGGGRAPFDVARDLWGLIDPAAL